jgi:hypothetical protein
MVKDKKTKKRNWYQITIHKVDPETYEKVVAKAKADRRSIAKTCEIMLEFFIAQHKL